MIRAASSISASAAPSAAAPALSARDCETGQEREPPSQQGGLARHRTLIELTLPLLAAGWQRGHLALSAQGEAAVGGSPGGRDRDAIAIELAFAPQARLQRLGGQHTLLAYPEAEARGARAALLAAAARPGWPIAGDAQSLALFTLAERIAASTIPVLLEGPTGTGKEVLARLVHRLSPRCDGPFVAVNCAAMPEAMLEALLFGHRKGAFTGAAEAGEGLFRAADGGTLLLDEIGELPLALQAKLLRALQEGEVLPLGATRPVAVDVRIVACTNRHLAAEAAAGRFREDLLYRLNVFPLALAALGERVGDIAPLAFGMLLRHAEGPAWIAPEALALLEAHPWPGNVRELENVVRRALVLAGGAGTLGAEHIVFDRAARPMPGAPLAQAADMAPAGTASTPLSRTLSDVAFASEAQAITDMLTRHGGNRARTAASLGISERTLRYRLASMRATGLIAGGAAGARA